MSKKTRPRLADNIRASLHEALEYAAGKKMKAHIVKKRRIKFEVGSGNIFADLGLPDAEELLLKSQIVVQLHRLIKARKLTQIAAAKRIGIGQPDFPTPGQIVEAGRKAYLAGRIPRRDEASPSSPTGGISRPS